MGGSSSRTRRFARSSATSATRSNSGRCPETHFVLGNFWKNHFNRLLAASGQPHPTAADLRRWMDQPEERGLAP